MSQLVRLGGARAVFICVTHAVLSQMPQELFCRPELVRMVVTNTVNQAQPPILGWQARTNAGLSNW